MKYFQKSILLFLLVISIVNASVSIKSMSGHPTPDVISMRPYIELINESDEIIDLSEIIIDYYIFEESLSAADLSWEDYWNNIDLHYEMNFYDLQETVENNGLKANIKCQISFTQEATALEAGTSLKMQHGIFKTGWNYTFNERDDWSFSLNPVYAYNEHIVATNHVTGEIIFGNSIEGNTVPRPYSVAVNWLGEHTFDDLKDVKIKEGDAILNSTDKISYIYYQDKWSLLSEVNTDLSNYATKTYVDNAVIIEPNSINASQISKNHLANVNADLLDGLHANEIIEAASGSTGGIDAEAKGYLKSIDEKLSTLISLQRVSIEQIPADINPSDYYIVRKMLDDNLLFNQTVASVVTVNSATGRVIFLSLAGKGITIIPPEISKLTELIRIELGNNKITNLPQEFYDLRNLQAVYLNSNLLKEISSEISKLEKLTILELGNNEISTLPIEICQLGKMFFLGLSSNQLINLPEDIGNMSFIHKLLIDNNPLEDLPLSIINLNQLINSINSFNFNIENTKLCNLDLTIEVWLDDVYNVEYQGLLVRDWKEDVDCN